MSITEQTNKINKFYYFFTFYYGRLPREKVEGEGEGSKDSLGSE